MRRESQEAATQGLPGPALAKARPGPGEDRGLTPGGATLELVAGAVTHTPRSRRVTKGLRHDRERNGITGPTGAGHFHGTVAASPPGTPAHHQISHTGGI